MARFVGACEPEKVNRTVFQAFLTAVAMFLLMAPIGYFAAPSLLDLVNAAPEVKAQALPFLRINFVFSIGMLLFFMLSSALRAAGDARTPLRLGVTMTILNLVLNLILVPRYGTTGSAMGTVIASNTASFVALYLLFKGKLVIRFSRHMEFRPDWAVIRSLFRFGLPTGVQGIAMNAAGVMLLRFIGSLEHSAAAQAAYAIGYTELFSMITWTSVGLMGAAATVAGQNLGAGHPERAIQGVHAASKIGISVASFVGVGFLVAPHLLLGLFGATEEKWRASASSCSLPGRLGVLHHRGPDLHRRPPGHGRHPQPAVHHAGLADCRPDRHVPGHPGDAPAGGVGYLAGHRPRPLHPLRAHGLPVPPGPLAPHQGGNRGRARLAAAFGRMPAGRRSS